MRGPSISICPATTSVKGCKLLPASPRELRRATKGNSLHSVTPAMLHVTAGSIIHGTISLRKCAAHLTSYRGTACIKSACHHISTTHQSVNHTQPLLISNHKAGHIFNTRYDCIFKDARAVDADIPCHECLHSGQPITTSRTAAAICSYPSPNGLNARYNAYCIYMQVLAPVLT